MTKSHLIQALAICVAALCALSPAARAQTGIPVDLVLVLAVDASGSITDDRWELERG